MAGTGAGYAPNRLICTISDFYGSTTVPFLFLGLHLPAVRHVLSCTRKNTDYLEPFWLRFFCPEIVKV